MNPWQKGVMKPANWFGIFCSTMALALMLTSAARAQVSGAISGTATDSSGAVLPGVNVIVRNLETGMIRAGVSDGTGRYSVLSLPVGRYEIRAQKAGFRAAAPHRHHPGRWTGGHGRLGPAIGRNQAAGDGDGRSAVGQRHADGERGFGRRAASQGPAAERPKLR